MGATPIITQKCSIEVDIKTNMMLYGVSVVKMRDKPISVYAVNVQKVPYKVPPIRGSPSRV